RKVVRRHRGLVGAATAFILLLAAAAVVSAVLAVRAEDARAKAEKAEGQARTALGESEQSRRELEQVVEYLVGAFRSPDPSKDGHRVTVAETVERALAGLDEKRVANPLVRARLLTALGRTLGGLGLHCEAADVLARGRALWEAERGADHPDTLEAAVDLAN